MIKSITPVLDSQIDQMGRVVRDGSEECVRIALQQMRTDGEFSKEQLQLALGRGNKIKQRLIPFYKKMMTELAKDDIIEWNSDLIIPAQSRFIVAENFRKDSPDVQFWYFGDNFQAMFMPMTEEATGKTTACIGKLRVQAKLAEMTPELGENRVLTTSQFFWMLRQQPRGEKPNGKNRRLFVDGSANILRILDKDGIERAVCAFWRGGGGWFISASGLGRQREWDAGGRVVSRK